MSKNNDGFKNLDSYHANFENADYKYESHYVNEDDSNYEKRSVNHHALMSILGIVFLILLLAVLIRRFKGVGSYPTFTGFLEYFTSIQPPEIPFTSLTVTDLGDWGWFNFFREFVMSFMSILDVLIFFVNGLLSVITYVALFFTWLFVV